MKGFKDFLLRGNLVELAVAFVMAAAFLTLVEATVQLILDLLGKIGGTPDFSGYSYHGVSVGAWLTAAVSFLIMAMVVYFLIVLPYTRAKELLQRHDQAEVVTAPEDIVLLTEIRDLLRGSGVSAPQP